MWPFVMSVSGQVVACQRTRQSLCGNWKRKFESVSKLKPKIAQLRGVRPERINVLLVISLTLIGVFLIMVLCLLCFHSYLILANLTTWECSSWRRITYLTQTVAFREFGYSLRSCFLRQYQHGVFQCVISRFLHKQRPLRRR